MKIKLPLLSLVFITINLYAYKNWIPLEPINNTQPSKQMTKKDVNLTQNGSTSALFNNIAAIKQLIDSTKKEKNIDDEKKWYPLDNMDNK